MADSGTFLNFASDYMEGAHPAIMERLMQTNLEQTEGYGTDHWCDAAREKIRKACGIDGGAVHFLIGGTQANAVVITALLRPYEGVLCAQTGHISVHEAGAIEAGGPKVLPLPHRLGKISAADVKEAVRAFAGDGNHDHMVAPGMVYISQPTEYGTLYSLDELTQLSEVCHASGLHLYVDGARLAYALASPANDVSLKDLARLCDVFYIGGTKCGALLGEAVVIPSESLIPHFFTITKQRGALLAKGRLLGIQFDTLFEDGLYERIGKTAVAYAARMEQLFVQNGYQLYFESPTNQVFVVLDEPARAHLEKQVSFSFWEKPDEEHTIVRLATSWATQAGAVEKLADVLEKTHA